MAAFSMSPLKVLLLSVGLASCLNIPRAAEGEDTFANVANGISLPLKRNPITETSGDRFQDEIVYLAAKYNIKPSAEHLARRAGEAGSSPAYPVRRGAQYNIQLNIGGQLLDVNPDLGSPLLWVPNTQVAGNRGAPYGWDPTKSKNAGCNNDTYWDITYGPSGGGASFSGQVCFDFINLPTSPNNKMFGPVFIANQSKSVANNGIFGLSHDSQDGYFYKGQRQYIFTYSSQLLKNVPQPLFTMDLKYDSSGSLDFGVIDYTKNTSTIIWTPRPGNVGGTWRISSTSILIAGTPGYFDAKRVIPATIDSGAQFMQMPADVVSHYYAGVVGASNRTGSYTFPCNSTLPNMFLGFQGRNIVIPGNYMIDSKNADGSCLGSVQNTGFADGVSFYGTSFIRPNFMIFLNSSSTYPDGAVGFASKNRPDPPPFS